MGVRESFMFKHIEARFKTNLLKKTATTFGFLSIILLIILPYVLIQQRINKTLIIGIIIALIIYVSAIQVLFSVLYRKLNSLISAEQMKSLRVINESEKKIREQAFRNSPTGIHNKNFLEFKIEEFINDDLCKNKKFTLVIINISNINEFQEVLGQDTSCNLMKFINTSINKKITEKAISVILNNHEFALFLPNIDEEEKILDCCKRINTIFDNPIEIDGFDVNVSLCIGIACFPKHGKNIDTLIQKARIAMSNCHKIPDNNILMFSQELEVYSKVQFETKKDLSKAVTNNELVLYYQPIINTNTEKIEKVEALIRWRHSERGLVSPGLFIPLAEESNVIFELGEWVLREACTQLKKWHDLGQNNLIMAINISPKQFEQNGFVSKVKKIIKETGVNPSYVELEITEGIAVKDTNSTLEKINVLNAIGISWSMDDFGTGYSSLGKLNELPLDTLKIDMSFIKDINENLDKTLLVSAIIAMAKNLEMKVVAEGVEKLDQFEFLKANQCDLIQGYLIHKPCDENDFGKLFNKEFSLHKRFIDEINREEDYEYNKFIKDNAYAVDLYDMGNKGYIQIDKEGKIIEANRILLEMLGYNWEDIKGKSYLDYLTKEYIKFTQNLLKDVKDNISVNIKIFKKDKSIMIASVDFMPIYSKDGQLENYNCLVKDITKIYTSEKEILEKRETYKRIFNNAPLAFIKWDKNMLIQEWNKHAEIIFGWSKEEVKGKNIVRLVVHKADEKQLVHKAQKILGGVNIHSINKNITKDNRRIECEWFNEVIYDIDGSLSYVISIVKEIRE